MRILPAYLWLVIGMYAQTQTIAGQQFEGRQPPPGQTGPATTRLAGQPQQTETNPEDFGSITGQVFDAATGQPLSKAHLTLFPTNPGTGRREPYLTFTDSSGTYRFVNIEPGNYRLSVVRNRYVRQNYGQKGTRGFGATISVAPKQHVRDINFRLLPGAVVTGRVVDEEGEPMAGVQVSAMQYRYLRGRRELAPAGSGVTNDLGEYRIWGIAPGNYYVSASYRSPAFVYSGSTQQDDSGYPVTYYPGVLDPSQTSPLAVKAAEQKNGIDFRLSPIRTVRISGAVKLMSGQAPRDIMLMLSKRDAYYSMERRGVAVREGSGQFEISGVTPGSYVLQAFTMRQEERLYAYVPVEVSASNIENLDVTLAPGLNLGGRIIVEPGAPQPPELERLRVVMYPREDAMRFGPGGDGPVQRDGSFALKNVPPMRSQLNVVPMPEGYYLKSVVLNGEEMVNTGVHLTPGMEGANFTVILSPNAARLDGAVVDEKDQPFPGATVLLLPADKTKRESILNLPMASSDQNGRYSLMNVAPGDYVLFAFADVEPGAWQDPDFLAPFEDHGKKVKLAPKDIQNLDVKLLRAGDEQ